MAPETPVTILIHGYRFDPGHPAYDPHRLLFAPTPARTCRRIRSWTSGLGVCDDPATGLCIGLGWRARESHAASLLASGRTGFVRVFDRAEAVGALLAELVSAIRAIAPERCVDVLAHSLGVRVALSGVSRLGCWNGRMILLAGAEFADTAQERLSGLRPGEVPEVYNFTARANDLYDKIFETFAPRRGPNDQAVGLGLRRPPPNWVDVQLDKAEVIASMRAAGVPLPGSLPRVCHWSFYTLAEAFEIYRRILGRAPGWDPATLRAGPCGTPQEPRWSRLAPAPLLQPSFSPGPDCDGSEALPA